MEALGDVAVVNMKAGLTLQLPDKSRNSILDKSVDGDGRLQVWDMSVTT